MNLDDLITLFRQELQKGGTPHLYSKHESVRDEKTPLMFNYRLYTLPTIGQFITKLLAERSRRQEYFLDFKAGRFVVDNEYRILIAREGDPSASVPSHSDIIPRVIAAGSFSFTPEDKDYLIDTISNKTGHFKCDMSSLVWPLAILLFSDDFPLAEILNIVLVTNSLEDTSNLIKYTLEVPVNELRKRMNGLFSPEEIVALKEVNSEHHVIHKIKKKGMAEEIPQKFPTDQSPVLERTGMFSSNKKQRCDLDADYDDSDDDFASRYCSSNRNR